MNNMPVILEGAAQRKAELRALATAEIENISGGYDIPNIFPSFEWTIGNGPGGDDGIEQD